MGTGLRRCDEMLERGIFMEGTEFAEVSLICSPCTLYLWGAIFLAGMRWRCLIPMNLIR
jgi:hypothetical protein